MRREAPQEGTAGEGYRLGHQEIRLTSQVRDPLQLRSQHTRRAKPGSGTRRGFGARRLPVRLGEIVEPQGEFALARHDPKDLHEALAQRLNPSAPQAVVFERGFGQASLQPAPSLTFSLPAGVGDGLFFVHSRQAWKRNIKARLNEQ